MKKIILLAIATILLLPACNKIGEQDSKEYSGEFISQLVFEVSDKVETRGILNLNKENGIWNVTWEDGDLITFKVEVLQEFPGQTGGLINRTLLDKVEGKVVYENDTWTTYIYEESNFKETEQISISSPSLDYCYVWTTFDFFNGEKRTDPDHFECTWHQIFPFKEGQQSVLIQLPFLNQLDDQGSQASE